MNWILTSEDALINLDNVKRIYQHNEKVYFISDENLNFYYESFKNEDDSKLAFANYCKRLINLDTSPESG
jgi:hypothetical protein